MKRMILVGVVCAFIAAPASADFYTTFDTQDGGDGTLISPYALAPGFLVETFDGVPGPYPSHPISSVSASLDQAWTWGAGVTGSENSAIFTGSQSTAAAPWNYISETADSTPYASIPYRTQETSVPRQASVYFGGAQYNYLGLHWGSMDPEDDGNWNQMILLFKGDITNSANLVAEVFAPLPQSGSWTDDESNRYVNIFLKGGLTFDRAVFQSNQYAFEFDNLTVGVVPVPGAVLLGFLGLGYAGMRLRKMV
jgi:hypothetical protein